MPSRDKKARVAAGASQPAGQPAGEPAAASTGATAGGQPGTPAAQQPPALAVAQGLARPLPAAAADHHSYAHRRVVLGGTYIVTAVQNALAYQRVETLASLSSDVTGLAAHLEDERDQTMEYIGEGTAGPGTLEPRTLRTARRRTWTWSGSSSRSPSPGSTRSSADSARIGAGYPAQVQNEAQNFRNVVSLLTPLRTAAVSTQLPAVDVMTRIHLGYRPAARHRRQHRARQR